MSVEIDRARVAYEAYCATHWNSASKPCPICPTWAGMTERTRAAWIAASKAAASYEPPGAGDAPPR